VRAGEHLTQDWVSTACPVCEGTAGSPVLRISDRDAPGEHGAIVRCSTCGLRRLDPRPAEHRISAYYGDEYNAYVGRSRGRVKQRVWDLLRDLSSGRQRLTRHSKAMKRVAQALTSRLVDINLAPAPGSSPTVLDVGCGYGDLLIYYKSRACRVRGVEADRRAAEKAAEYGIDVVVEDPAQISLPSGSVDATILCHSLEHLPDPRAALIEIARVSRPGAELHIAVPNGDAAGLERQGAAWGHISYPLHFWYFDADSLLRLVRETGFKTETVTYRMTWGFHRLTWRRARELQGWSPVVRDVAETVARVVWRPSRKDVLRLTARRDG
jgi:SAM-dependent methyltransferase